MMELQQKGVSLDFITLDFRILIVILSRGNSSSSKFKGQEGVIRLEMDSMFDSQPLLEEIMASFTKS